MCEFKEILNYWPCRLSSDDENFTFCFSIYDTLGDLIFARSYNSLTKFLDDDQCRNKFLGCIYDTEAIKFSRDKRSFLTCKKSKIRYLLVVYEAIVQTKRWFNNNARLLGVLSHLDQSNLNSIKSDFIHKLKCEIQDLLIGQLTHIPDSLIHVVVAYIPYIKSQ